MSISNKIVIFHGFGSDANDMNFFKHHWQYPDWEVVTLNGPLKIATGYAWFDLYSDNWVEGIDYAAKHIDTQFANHAGKLIFSGFSQGAFLAAYLSLYGKSKVHGCICFSGGIIPIAQPPKQTPMILIHGEADDVITKDWYLQSMNFGIENGLAIEGLLIPDMRHEINEIALEYGTKNLEKLIAM